VTAFAPVSDVRDTLTPYMRSDAGPTVLMLIDLGAGRMRLGGSAFAQAYGQMGSEAPDLDEPQRLKAFFEAIQELNTRKKLLAYHDRSDGGLFDALCELMI